MQRRAGAAYVDVKPEGPAAFWGDGGALYDELIRFANLTPAEIDDGAAVREIFDYLAPAKGARSFYKDARVFAARWLVHAAFNDLATVGSLSKRTEYAVDRVLAGIRFTGRYELHNMKSRTVLRLQFPTIEDVCAYGIASLVATDQYDCIRRCLLAECEQFFWCPRTRGARATYCCTSHRNRGAKREQRDKSIKKRARGLGVKRKGVNRR